MHYFARVCERADDDAIVRFSPHRGKAIHAARLALRGEGTHRVSLDKVIATMRQTGADISTNTNKPSGVSL